MEVLQEFSEVTQLAGFAHAYTFQTEVLWGRVKIVLRPVILQWWHLGWFAPDQGFWKVKSAKNRVLEGKTFSVYGFERVQPSQSRFSLRYKIGFRGGTTFAK